MRPERHPTNRQHGFGLVAAMFLIIVIAGVIAAMARMAVTQNATTSLALQQARAYQAARAGLEWGIYQVMKGDDCTTEFFPGGMEGVRVEVKCEVWPPDPWEEEGKKLRFYTLTARAESLGGISSVDYVWRSLTATVERTVD